MIKKLMSFAILLSIICLPTTSSYVIINDLEGTVHQVNEIEIKLRLYDKAINTHAVCLIMIFFIDFLTYSSVTLLSFAITSFYYLKLGMTLNSSIESVR